jgi:hypothetical protein
MSRGVVPVDGRKVRRTDRPRNAYTGAAKGHVDDKTFDQMAGELKA